MEFFFAIILIILTRMQAEITLNHILRLVRLFLMENQYLLCEEIQGQMMFRYGTLIKETVYLYQLNNMIHSAVLLNIQRKKMEMLKNSFQICYKLGVLYLKIMFILIFKMFLNRKMLILIFRMINYGSLSWHKGND